MLHKEAKYNRRTKKGTYSHYMGHGELLPNSKAPNGAPNAFGQKLAASEGIIGAKRLLAGKYKH